MTWARYVVFTRSSLVTLWLMDARSTIRVLDWRTIEAYLNVQGLDSGAKEVTEGNNCLRLVGTRSDSYLIEVGGLGCSSEGTEGVKLLGVARRPRKETTSFKSFGLNDGNKKKTYTGTHKRHAPEIVTRTLCLSRLRHSSYNTDPVQISRNFCFSFYKTNPLTLFLKVVPMNFTQDLLFLLTGSPPLPLT